MIEKNALSQLQAQVHQLECYKVEIAYINKTINLHSRLIEEANNRMNVPFEFENFKTDIKKEITSLVNKQNQIFSALHNTSKELDEIKRNVAGINQLLCEHISRFESIKESINSHKSETKSKLDLTNKSFSEAFSAYRESVNKKLLESENKLSSIPQSILDKNNKILKDLEIISEDTKNSCLKVDNVDLNIKVLERKVENLALQLKRMQLTQQIT